MNVFDDVVRDIDGVIVAGAKVYIYSSAGTLASLFESDGTTPKDNPLVSDALGQVKAWLTDDGYYTAEYFWGGRKRYVRANVLLGSSPLQQVIDEGEAQIVAVNTAGTTQIAAVNSAGATQIALATAQATAAAGSATSADGFRARASNAVPFTTWTALAAATGMSAGDKAQVLAADTGTHTDPVVGGTVNNAGVYTYSASPAGWQRVGDLDSQTASAQVELVTAEGEEQVARVNAAGTALSAVNVGLGIPAADVATTTYGSGGDTTNLGASQFIASQLCPGKPELLSDVTIQQSIPGTAVTIHILRVADSTVQQVFTGLTPNGSGVISESQFNGYILPAGHTPAFMPASGVARYAAGTEGALYYASSTYNGVIGDTVTVTRSNTLNAGISYKTRAVPATHEDRLDAAEPAVADNLRATVSDLARDPMVVIIGDADLDAGDDGTGTARGHLNGIPFRSVLKHFSIRVSKATYGELLVVNQRSNVLRYVLPFFIPAAGKNRMEVRGGGVVIEPGDLIMWRSIMGGVMRLSAVGSGALLTRNSNFTATGVLTVGQSVTPARATSSVPALQFELHRIPRPATERTPVFRQLFAGTSAPSGWTGTTTGVFSVNEGLNATGTGGWTSIASWDFDSAMHRKTIAASITVTGTTESGAINTTRTTGSVAQPSGAVKFDGATNTLAIVSALGATTYDIKSVTIPALVAGRTYLLEAIQRGNLVFGRWTDTVTGTRTVVSNMSAERYTNNCDFHGKPGYVHLSGTVKVNWFSLTNDLPKNLRAVIVGDSNLEGDADVISMGLSWGHLVAERGAVGISAIGGSNSTDVLNRFTADVTPHTVEKLIVASGTNDTTQAFYRTRIAAIIAAAPAGCETVLVTQPPRTISNPTIGPLCNTDVRNRYFGAYRYVDFALALSTGYDGTTMPAAYFPDSLHMNALGQELAFQCFKGSLPEVLEP